MSEDDQLEESIRDLIVDVCEVLYRRGYTAVPVGAVMRLVGVELEKSRSHDNEFFQLDEDFQELIEQRNTLLTPPPDGVTLH